jgi:hypothetical protein
MPTVYRHLKKYFLIYLGLVIYLLFFISVAWTGWFDVFFSGAALHVGAKGIDFYQLPKGAWGFLHGATLVGDHLPAGTPYTDAYFSNGNVYHPLFTLTVGWFLTLFDPARAPYVWLWVKLPISLLVVGYFFWSFRTSKYINFAVFILLANFSIYLELAAWQFHFVLNMFLMLFFIVLVKKRSVLWNGVLYWLGMLIKPIGLLFVPTLLFKGRWKIALIGIWFFILSTVLFTIHDTGAYYTSNLLANLSTSGTAGPNQIITLSALLHYMTSWPDIVYTAIQDGFLALVLFLSALKRIHIAQAIFLYIVYYLCFYQAVYEYQWSTLAYILAICIVVCPSFQTRFARFCILLTCLPDCFILLNQMHVDVKDLGYLGMIPGGTAWEWMVVSKLIPLFLVVVSVLFADVKPIFKEMKAFLGAMRRINAQLEVFGEQKEVKKAISEVLPEPAATVETLV